MPTNDDDGFLWSDDDEATLGGELSADDLGLGEPSPGVPPPPGAPPQPPPAAPSDEDPTLGGPRSPDPFGDGLDRFALGGDDLGGDPSRTEGWEARRMDRYERLPGQEPPRRRPPRSKRGRSGTIWRRRLVALAFLIALVIVVIVIVKVTSGGDDEGSAKSGGGTVATSPSASATASSSASPTASPSPSATPSVRIVSGGDVMGDRQVEAYANANGGDAVLRGVAPAFRKGDAAWVNLESPLTRLGSPWPGKDVTFQGSPLIAPALGRAGLDVVTMANNHACDYGAAALVDTIKRVEKGGVEVVGAGRNDADAWQPAVIETKGGATVGFLAWTDIVWEGYVASGKPGVATARLELARMKSAIRKLAKKVDYVVVGYHWGIEYENYPNSALQTNEAHAAINAGADLVIGHHPHVLQGFEVYKGHLIAYSLGDLAFDHSDIPTGQTVLVDAVLTPKGITATLIPVYASSQGIPAVQHGANARTILNLVKRYSAPFKTKIVIRGDTATIRGSR